VCVCVCVFIRATNPFQYQIPSSLHSLEKEGMCGARWCLV
jgi:hypothetical protein